MFGPAHGGSVELRSPELAGDHIAQQPGDGGRVEMVEDRLECGIVKRGEFGHVLVAQLEVEHVDVLLHTFLVRGFGDHGHALLQEGAQDHLTGGFAVLRADAREHGVGEDALLAFGERRPRLMRHAQFGHGLVRGVLLAERVRFDLVDGRGDFRERAYVDESFGVEVGDADGADFAGFVGVFHGTVGSGVVAHGLVEEHEVDVVDVHGGKACVDGGGGAVVVHVGDPDLAGDEKILSGNSAFGQWHGQRFLHFYKPEAVSIMR